jgi:hypothetical protein
MARQFIKKVWQNHYIILLIPVFAACLGICGCSGYSTQSLYADNVSTVYVEMFDNKSFWRGVEYSLTDALAKRIEEQTPYKIVSNRDKADTVISGYLENIDQTALSYERQTGRALEKEVYLQAVVNWKNLKTGELVLDRAPIAAAASYSEWQSQGFRYGSTLAANNLAVKIVEAMEKKW